MRRVLAGCLIALSAGSAAAESDPYIHAPVPPYCSPRGDWEDCSSEPILSGEVVFSSEELSNLGENLLVIREEVNREFWIAGGYAKLNLWWSEGEGDPYAFMQVVSGRRLTTRGVIKLAARFEQILQSRGVLAIEVERYLWPWQREPEADWCELERQAVDDDWNLNCGAVPAAPHNKPMQTDEPLRSPSRPPLS